MAKPRTRVHDLANEAEITPDEVLLALWRDGFDYINAPVDPIKKGDVDCARRAIGLPTIHELNSVVYWQQVFRLSPDDFAILLMELGFRPQQAKRTLPTGAIRKLRAEKKRRQLVAVTEPPSRDATATTSAPPSFVWEQIGHESVVNLLSYADLVNIHNTLVQDFQGNRDPIQPAGIKNATMLQSAISRPATRIGADLKYRTVEMSAAALLHSLVLNHPFHNGNKRTALVAMLVFLDKNGLLLNCEEDELFKLVLQVAQHTVTDNHPTNLPDREVIAIARWIHSRCRIVEKGEIPIPFRTLRRILKMFACSIECCDGHARITRIVDDNPRWFGSASKITLSVQIAYGGEGREVPQNTLAKIRADLRLNDDHNVDSKAFYQGELNSADDFIAHYRTTLRRLSRL